VLAALAVAAPAAAAPTLTPVGTFDQPVYVTAPPGDPHRLFVVEKPGVVKVIVDGGAPQVFLDISAEVDETADNEEGLLSIGFAPDYATSRRFYAYFTAVDPTMGGGSRIKLVEFTRPEATPNAADPTARRTLVEIPHPTASNHNGGQLQVASDGAVWFAVGDGAVSSLDAQNPDKLLGKLVRLDPTAQPPQPQIYASGLRNPWRFSIDRGTGDLVIGDVGGGVREEIDFAPAGTPAGRNYGWPCFEGRAAGPVNCTVTNPVAPVLDYPNPAGPTAVTGGYVVRDPGLPTLVGRYIYTDAYREEMRSLVLATPDATGDRAEASLRLASTVSFGEDSCGHLYAASLAGTVARIHDGPVTACPDPPSPGPGPAPTPNPSPGPEPEPDPQPTPPAADTRAPSLSVSRARRQRLLGSKAVYVGARCDEACSLAVESNVRLRIAGRTRNWAFPPRTAAAPAGASRRLKLRLTKAMRAALAQRVARGALPLVKAVVIARDAAGNEARRTVYVRVVG
jgi:hypothetical protein